MHSALAQPAAAGVDATQIADLALLTWRDVDAALSPIVGQRGVAALYKRSLYLTKAEHPCLAPVYEGELEPGEFSTLQLALSQQTSADAAAANRALLHTLHALLAKLIGAALTDQLLRTVADGPAFDNPAVDNPAFDNPAFDNPAVDNPSSGDAVQDISP